MDAVKRGKRASENQKEYLINFLEENVDLANDKFVTVDGSKFREEKWKELAASINALGGTQKDGPKWRKYWSDLRLHTRTKYSAIKQAEQRSGINGLSRAKALTPLEERIIKITTIEAVDGDHTSEVGFEKNSNSSRQTDASAVSEVAEEFRGFESDDAADVVVTAGVSSANAPAPATSRVNTPALATSRVNTPAPATSRGNVAASSRRAKKKTQPESPYMEKFFKLKEKKLAVLENANTLKREQIEAIKKQTEAVESLNNLINILVQRT